MIYKEPIQPNFDFTRFPIFAFKIVWLKRIKNIILNQQSNKQNQASGLPTNPFSIQYLLHSTRLAGSSLTLFITDKFWMGWIPELITSQISRTC